MASLRSRLSSACMGRLGAAPSERIRRELAAKIGARQRMATRSSPIAYVGLAWLLSQFAPSGPLAVWVAVQAVCTLLLEFFQARLVPVLDDPTAREKVLARMRAVHLVSGTTWGCALFLVPLDSGTGLLLCTMCLAVVVMIASQNVSYDRRALLTFVGMMAFPSLLWAASLDHPMAPTIGMIWILLLPLVWIYAGTNRQMFLGELGARRSLEEMSAELREKNASLEQALSTIEVLARRDPLTGTWNRRAGIEALAREASHASRAGEQLGLLMIDLDHFKRINDTWGHQAGDAVLVEAANRLQAALRPTDHLVRWGGEEFLVLVRRPDAASLRDMAQRLRRAIGERPFEIAGQPRPVTASAGLALAAPDGVEACLRRADEALYEAKRAGRDLVVMDEAPATPARRVSAPV